MSKRGNIVPKLPGGKLTLIPLAYPESGALYTGPRSTTPKEVFDFKDKKLGTTSIKKFTDYNSKSTADYATEYIIEVSASFKMIAMFAYCFASSCSLMVCSCCLRLERTKR